MVTQKTSRDIRLAALRVVYQQTFRQYLLEVRALQALAGQKQPEPQALETARRRMSEALSAYRQSRDAFADYLLGRQSAPAGIGLGAPGALIRAQVERLAHQLWEQSGRPMGRAEEHWYQAESLMHSAV